MRGPRTIAGLATSALVGVLLAGCDDGGGTSDGPAPDATVRALAGALSSGDFADSANLAFRQQTVEQVAEAYDTSCTTSTRPPPR